MALIDISRTISPATAVWPGDQEVVWSWTSHLEQDDASVNVGAVRMSTHTATHVDAPFHVQEQGRQINELPLSPFVGPVEVVDVKNASVIRAEHVEEVGTKRVLFKTSASTLPDDEWPEVITPLDVGTVRRLEEKGSVLIGTDAPSVDPLDSTSLPAHHALVESGIVNLEGLCLEDVSPGPYFLMAFPLRISGADAAPVRAILSDSEPESRP